MYVSPHYIILEKKRKRIRTKLKVKKDISGGKKNEGPHPNKINQIKYPTIIITTITTTTIRIIIKGLKHKH
jgi:hypothetical protein